MNRREFLGRTAVGAAAWVAASRISVPSAHSQKSADAPAPGGGQRKLVIDAHCHIFSELRGRTRDGPIRSLAYGKMQVGEGVAQLLPPLNPTTTFPPEALLANMDWVGVDKAVLLQGPFYGSANEYVWKAVQRWPDRFIGAGELNPRAPDARETFRRVTEEYGFRAIKLEMSVPTGYVGLYPDLRLDEEPLGWLWDEAERRRIVMTLDLGAVGSASHQTDAVRKILDGHPTLKIVICHLAQPAAQAPDDKRLDRLWQDQILLAREHNVWFDIASLPAYARAEDYPSPTSRQYLRRAVELVGAERIMWGTDIPGLLSFATYPQLLDWVTRHCDFLSESDQAKILGENAWQVYK